MIKFINGKYQAWLVSYSGRYIYFGEFKSSKLAKDVIEKYLWSI